MLLATLFSACNASKRNQQKELEQQIGQVLKDKKATVGVAVLANDTIVALHNNQIHFPLFSVFKFHVALAVLDKMDKEHVSLDSIMEIKAAQMLPNTYSPLRQKFPDRDFSISLGELLKYSISLSDNNACDVLIDYVGGIDKVNSYIKSLGLKDFNLAANEDLMHRDVAIQYQNWSTPEAVVRLLNIADKQTLFAAGYKDFLWQILKETSTGTDKLKGELPPRCYRRTQNRFFGQNTRRCENRRQRRWLHYPSGRTEILYHRPRHGIAGNRPGKCSHHRPYIQDSI